MLPNTFNYNLNRKDKKLFKINLFILIFFFFVTFSFYYNPQHIDNVITISNQIGNYVKDKYKTVTEPPVICEEILLGNGNFSEVLKYRCFIHWANPKSKDFNTFYAHEVCLRVWRPHGCSLYEYSSKKATKCFRSFPKGKKYMFLIGDSRMRGLFPFFYNTLRGSKVIELYPDDLFSSLNKELQLNITYTKLLWMNQTFVDYIQEVKEIAKNHQTIVIIGITLHMILKYVDNPEEGLKEFSFYLNKAKSTLYELGEYSTVFWFMQPNKTESFKAQLRGVAREVKYNPPKDKNEKLIYDAEYNERTINRTKEILIGQRKRLRAFRVLNKYNEIAAQILKGSSVKLWHGARIMGNQVLDDYEDHVHFPSYLSFNYMQIVLNLLCNEKMDLNSNEYCCSSF